MKKYILLYLFVAVLCGDTLQALQPEALPTNLQPEQPIDEHGELKIYRRKTGGLEIFMTILLVSAFAGASYMFIKGAQILENDPKRKNSRDTTQHYVCATILGSLGVLCAVLFGKSWYQNHLNRHKPVLVFDEDGFTYETKGDFWGNMKDERYEWADVYRGWIEITTRDGSEVSRRWCYVARGHKDTIEIPLYKLDLGPYSQDQIEQIRVGNIRALDQEF